MGIKVIIADNSYLSVQGFRALIKECDDIVVVNELEKNTELLSRVEEHKPDVLIIDYSSPYFSIQDISDVITLQPKTGILAITPLISTDEIKDALQAGASGHILKDCSKEEIIDAIYSTAKADHFYCGKVIDRLNDKPADAVETSCDGFRLSNREIEIIGHIADGMTNKEIADKLFLSTHTVMTHRKNIMAKLGINNTAGIVIYAVKEKIIFPNKYLFAPVEE